MSEPGLLSQVHLCVALVPELCRGRIYMAMTVVRVFLNGTVLSKIVVLISWRTSFCVFTSEPFKWQEFAFKGLMKALTCLEGD
jgi:hypothetical protein